MGGPLPVRVGAGCRTGSPGRDGSGRRCDGRPVSTCVGDLNASIAPEDLAALGGTRESPIRCSGMLFRSGITVCEGWDRTARS